MARQRQTVPTTRKEVYCQVLLACLFYALMALLPLGVLAAPSDSGTAASGSNPAEDAAAISVAPARQQRTNLECSSVAHRRSPETYGAG